MERFIYIVAVGLVLAYIGFSIWLVFSRNSVWKSIASSIGCIFCSFIVVSIAHAIAMVLCWGIVVILVLGIICLIFINS